MLFNHKSRLKKNNNNKRYNDYLLLTEKSQCMGLKTNSISKIGHLAGTKKTFLKYCLVVYIIRCTNLRCISSSMWYNLFLDIEPFKTWNGEGITPLPLSLKSCK